MYLGKETMGKFNEFRLRDTNVKKPRKVNMYFSSNTVVLYNKLERSV